MKIKWSGLLCSMMVLCLMTACNNANEVDAPVAPDALFGYWKKQNADESTYLRFMSESDDERDGDYLFGYEFYPDQDGSDIQEEELWSEEQYHGNGWFKYKMTASSKDTTLHEIHLMDNGGADIPKTYLIKQLTSSVLVYADDFGVNQTFIKSAQPK